MAVDVSVSMYIGAAIAGVSLVIYLAGMLYPSKVGNADEANKIFAWAALAAFANLVLQTNLLADMGQYLRWDGLEFNYERWIINSICMLFLGLAATCYGWHDLIHGYWAVFSGVLCAVAMIFAGMTSNEARWVWFIYGLTAGFVSFYFGFFKANWTVGGDLRKNNFWRNIVLLGIALLYVFLGLQIAILFFSNEMLHILGDNDVRDWLYWVGTSGFAVLGLLIGLTYMPAPLSLVNPVYALVPTSAASEHLSAVDSSLSGKSKNY